MNGQVVGSVEPSCTEWQGGRDDAASSSNAREVAGSSQLIQLRHRARGAACQWRPSNRRLLFASLDSRGADLRVGQVQSGQ